MDNKIIITAAVTGSFPTKEMNPAVPYTPEEIAKSAVDCYKAGAAITHVHVRDPETGRPAYDTDLFRRVLEGIREQCDMVVNLTTSGLRLKPDDISGRLEPVSLKSDICSFDLGSMNFQDRVFINSPQWADAAAKAMQAQGVKPEIEVFDVGHIYQAIDLVDRGLINDPPYFQICMGVRWGIAGTPENLLFMKSKLPSTAIWSVLGIQKAQLPMRWALKTTFI
jgi:3-keto-5-aminohexanoate cleavage enzyme